MQDGWMTYVTFLPHYSQLASGEFPHAAVSADCTVGLVRMSATCLLWHTQCHQLCIWAVSEVGKTHAEVQVSLIPVPTGIVASRYETRVNSSWLPTGKHCHVLKSTRNQSHSFLGFSFVCFIHHNICFAEIDWNRLGAVLQFSYILHQPSPDYNLKFNRLYP